MTIQEVEQLRAAGRQRIAVTLAACALGCRRRGYRERQPKIYTGCLEGRRRAYRGQPVVLADGSLAFVFGIQRGKAALWKDSPFVIGEREHMVLDVSQIRRYTLPSAVELGRLKAGKRERPSERKKESCRRNGRRPCAPGRARGRPKKPTGTSERRNLGTAAAPEDGRPPVADYAACVKYWSQHGSSHGRSL